MNKDLENRIKEKHRLRFKFISASSKKARDTAELHEQYRKVSKELKTDIRNEVIKFGSNLENQTENAILLHKNWQTTLTSDSGEDFSTPAEIADSLNTYFQSVFVKEKTACNDDGEAIFTLEVLYQEIDKLKDNKTICVDKASPIILKGGKAALSGPLLIIFQKSFSEGIVL